MSNQIKVIYIVGAAHSGSTLVDFALGSSDEAVSCGELQYLPEAWQAGNQYCSCGEQAKACKFWPEVLHKWYAKSHVQSLDELRALSNQFEDKRYFPRLLGVTPNKNQKFRRYQQALVALYQSIAEVSSSPVIIDSSKHPIRCLALSKMNEIDLRVVHLVRDGRAFLWSSKKKALKKAEKRGEHKRFSFMYAIRQALKWIGIHKLARYVAQKADHSICVRYEDFVDNTSGELKRIEQACDIKLNSVAHYLSEGISLDNRHVLTGNRIRRQQALSIKADQSWRDKLSDKEKQLFWLVASKTASRYNYSK